MYELLQLKPLGLCFYIIIICSAILPDFANKYTRVYPIICAIIFHACLLLLF